MKELNLLGGMTCDDGRGADHSRLGHGATHGHGLYHRGLVDGHHSCHMDS